MTISFLICLVCIWLAGVVVLLPFSYPNDPSTTILWWPLWLVTVFPIILIKSIWRFMKHIGQQMVEAYKYF
jgi:hypothetical protein